MNRIIALSKLIDHCQCVYDVGCDHALLAINLLKQKKCQHVVNIDNKKQPLANGISNLKNNHLLKKTTNILNNGLYQITKKTSLKPSYIVCGGLGTKTIISILQSCDKKLQTRPFILLAHKNVEHLRKWLNLHSYVIKKELTFCDANKFYQILLVSLSKKNKQTYQSRKDYDWYYFGQVKKQLCLDNWFKLLHYYKNKILKKKLCVYNTKYQKMLLFINKELLLEK